MDTSGSSIQTHYGVAQVASVGPRDRLIGISPVEHKLSYINNLPFPVTIVLRSGLKYTLPRQLSMTDHNLIMRTELVLHRSAVADIQRTLSIVGEKSSSELKAMKQALSYQLETNIHGGATLIIDYPLTCETLREFGGTVYFHELDIVVSMLDIDSAPPHPYSEQGRNFALVMSGGRNAFQESRFSYEIELIDNSNRHGPRYLNIGNQIYKIDTIQDPAKQDGVYVISDKTAEEKVGQEDKVVKYFTFEEAEKNLGLFRTFEEAKNLGDTSAARKFEMARLEHDALLAKNELQTSKHAHEMLVLEREREMKIMELERTRHAEEIKRLSELMEYNLKLEREKVKDFYEARSYQRKDESEIMKAIPTILIGIAGIFMAFKSFQTKLF